VEAPQINEMQWTKPVLRDEASPLIHVVGAARNSAHAAIATTGKGAAMGTETGS
jgi:hypothetical protein